MVDLNHVVLIGRLTREAELKFTSGGQAVCKFSIAVNRRKKSGDQWEDEANFFDIVLWGRQGEALHQYLVKGKMVGVDGELRQDRWQQDGQNRSKVEIVANNLQLLSGGSSDRQNYQGSSSSDSSSRESASDGASRDSSSSGYGGGGSSKDDGFADDIPF
jgi:single-strand DNA-binding protein